MPSSRKNPIKYVLYSHYFNCEIEDFDKYKEELYKKISKINHGHYKYFGKFKEFLSEEKNRITPLDLKIYKLYMSRSIFIQNKRIFDLNKSEIKPDDLKDLKTSTMSLFKSSKVTDIDKADFHQFKDMLDNKRVDVKPELFSGIEFLVSHFNGLRELLIGLGFNGMLVLFYDRGYASFLGSIIDPNNDRIDLENKFSGEFDDYINEQLKKYNLSDRVRIIIPEKLQVILGNVNAITVKTLKEYFLGDKPGIRYDAPKVVEAIIRLRLIGNGIPVFRIDQDVLFGKNKITGYLELFKSVAIAIRAYRDRMREPTVSTFLFSASYNTQNLTELKDKITPKMSKEEIGELRFKAWSRAFATRVFPALVFNAKTINNIYNLNIDEKEKIKKAWNNYVTDKDNLIDECLTEFYGLKNQLPELKGDGVKGLTSIGAHPFNAVISGALLCISDGAILDLPPFSNFRNNVMWIDDHLKYSLHRAMHHFISGEIFSTEEGLNHARLNEVLVTKARPQPNDLANYIFGEYLPTLLRGTIMDSWITSNPILKIRSGDSKNNQRRRMVAIGNQNSAPLPKALLKTLNAGEFTQEIQNELTKELEESAVERINMVKKVWSNMMDSNNGVSRETFASIWAKGKVKSSGVDNKIFRGQKTGLWKGLVKNNNTGRYKKLTDLPADISEEVRILRDDAVKYVNWTLEWPKFVQIVRSVPQGKFAGDLTY